ncbi:MAG: pilus assembly protein PilM [Roseburia sp.]
MSDAHVYEEPLVFGLDIGTRNVVGTVGYRRDKEFIVVAQQVMEHETRAMLDGQIHDIGRVGKVVDKVKEALEEQIGEPLTEVCIAAAGRVLKTVTTTIEYKFSEETVVSGEDVHTLDLLGIEKAQEILKEWNDTRYKFYCVGYSVVKYYLNDEPFSNLESHKAEKISEEIIVTFLPEDVVDGLYAAVGQAGLSVANMTLEPIAAINVAIPESFRLLNIALVDIGAGTSDISVTRDGSIIAYGMIPLAGDELTELIVQHYLVDFNTAEYIKLHSGMEDEVTYKDIMMIEHTIPSSEVWELTKPVVDKMTTEVAAKIKELNGDKTVSAAFIVGGGGKIHGYTEMLAEKLELPKERVALRGEEVLQEVTFEQKEIKKDPLLVTPIGICLNYYDQRNSFIMVRFNGERVKLYDNNKLTIVDAALQAGFPNEDLFPKRGKELTFSVNGTTRIVRGEAGESAMIYMNGKPVSINSPLEPNSEIVVEPSTAGSEAVCTLGQLEEAAEDSMIFIVNGQRVRCPKFLEVNGSLELPSYLIQEGDQIETRSFYTVGQLVEFMDVELEQDREILVNNRSASMDTLIYENFSIDWTVLSFGSADFSYVPNLPQEEPESAGTEISGQTLEARQPGEGETTGTVAENTVAAGKVAADALAQTVSDKEEMTAETAGTVRAAENSAEPGTEMPQTEPAEKQQGIGIMVYINGQPVRLTGKDSYIFVDIFDFYDFNLAESRGRAVITNLNGQNAVYTAPLNAGDRIELGWKEL